MVDLKENCIAQVEKLFWQLAVGTEETVCCGYDDGVYKVSHKTLK